jgi:hypothetical protein
MGPNRSRFPPTRRHEPSEVIARSRPDRGHVSADRLTCRRNTQLSTSLPGRVILRWLGAVAGYQQSQAEYD